MQIFYRFIQFYSYLFHPPLISLAPKNVIRSIIFHRRNTDGFWTPSKSKSRSVEKHRQHSQGSQILARAPAALPRFAPLQSLGRRALQPAKNCNKKDVIIFCCMMWYDTCIYKFALDHPIIWIVSYCLPNLWGWRCKSQIPWSMNVTVIYNTLTSSSPYMEVC